MISSFWKEKKLVTMDKFLICRWGKCLGWCVTIAKNRNLIFQQVLQLNYHLLLIYQLFVKILKLPNPIHQSIRTIILQLKMNLLKHLLRDKNIKFIYTANYKYKHGNSCPWCELQLYNYFQRLYSEFKIICRSEMGFRHSIYNVSREHSRFIFTYMLQIYIRPGISHIYSRSMYTCTMQSCKE